MISQFEFDYIFERHVEIFKRLQDDLDMNDIETQKLRVIIMTKMKKQSVKYCNMKNVTTKFKIERVNAIAKIHLATRLNDISTK